MQVVTVGTGAAYGRAHEVQTCVLVRSHTTTLCIDLGAGALNRLCRHLPAHQLGGVFITHLHPDHIADLAALWVYMRWGPGQGRRLTVMAPDGLQAVLAAWGLTDECPFDFVVPQPYGGTWQVGDLNIEYRPVPHLDPTYAVKVTTSSASMCFGADCAPNTSLPQLASGVDLLICECSFGAESVPEAVPHLNAADAADIARQADVGHLVLTHIYPEHDAHRAVDLARQRGCAHTTWAQPDAVFCL